MAENQKGMGKDSCHLCELIEVKRDLQWLAAKLTVNKNNMAGYWCLFLSIRWKWKTRMNSKGCKSESSHRPVIAFSVALPRPVNADKPGAEYSRLILRMKRVWVLVTPRIDVKFQFNKRILGATLTWLTVYDYISQSNERAAEGFMSLYVVSSAVLQMGTFVL